MKLHYNYIFIILSILLLLTFLNVIHIQKDPGIIHTNTVEFFENKYQDSKTKNKDNLESKENNNLQIKPSNDTINKKGSNLIIDFIDPPGIHNTMENLFMKWTKKTPGIVIQSLIYNNKIYGLGLDSQIWEFPFFPCFHFHLFVEEKKVSVLNLSEYSAINIQKTYIRTYIEIDINRHRLLVLQAYNSFG